MKSNISCQALNLITSTINCKANKFSFDKTFKTLFITLEDVGNSYYDYC